MNNIVIFDKLKLDIDDYLLEEDSLWRDDTLYTFNEKSVPRVSMIFKKAIGNEALMNWAARMGYSRMNFYRTQATTIGSIVHSMIEHHLKTGQNLEVSQSDYDLDISGWEMVYTSYNNYRSWKESIEENGNVINDIIGCEVEISCPWYGGTLDALMVINNAVYVIDFKTSKQINVQYIMQTCAYAWMINNGYCSICNHVDGIGILRFDKKSDNKFEEFFLNYHIPYQSTLLYQYTSAFFSLVNSYYHLMYIEDNFVHIECNDYMIENIKEGLING